MLQEFRYRQVKFIPKLYFANDFDRTREELVKDCETINRLATETNDTYKRNYLVIGQLLLKIQTSGCYASAVRTDGDGFKTISDTYHSKFLSDGFYQFCERHFRLSKTTVFTLMQVATLFSDENGVAIGRYKEFRYSQLVELCSFKTNDRKLIKPDMTIAEIRAMKKKLYSPEEPKKEEETPPAETAKRPKYVFCDMSTKKIAFQKHIKQLFDNRSYGVTCKGRAQGGYSFASALWDYLEEKGFFNHEEYSQQTLPL